MIKGLDDFLDEATDKGQVVGTWGFHANMDFTKMSVEETNVWFFEQVFYFLRAFFGLVMPDSLEVITHNATQHIERKGMDQQTFLDELMLVMKKVKEPLWTLRVNLSIVGFLRTAHDPDNPVRLKIQEPSSFIVWGGPDENGFQSFSTSYKILNAQKLEGEHNSLWSMNRELLDKALRRWEEQTGHRIDVVDANANIPVNQYGFGDEQGAEQDFGDFNFDSSASEKDFYGEEEDETDEGEYDEDYDEEYDEDEDYGDDEDYEDDETDDEEYEEIVEGLEEDEHDEEPVRSK